MKIVEAVVKIPKFVYDMTKAQKKVIDADVEIVGKAIANGTVLPKGHGKIADLSAVYEDICNDLNKMTRVGVVVDGGWLWAKLNDAIDHAPTIIEADKAGDTE